MAIKAGRVGVHPTEINRRGKIKDKGLTPEQSAKLDRALVSPITTPQAKQVAGVDTGNSQIMANVGRGLALHGSTSPYTLGLDTPEFSSADAGKVLTIGDDGTLEWDEKGTGGGITTHKLNSGVLVENLVVSSTGTVTKSLGNDMYVFPCGRSIKGIWVKYNFGGSATNGITVGGGSKALPVQGDNAIFCTSQTIASSTTTVREFTFTPVELDYVYITHYRGTVAYIEFILE